MPEDYYPTEQAGESNIPPAGATKPKTDAETALMPKALFGEVAVGDTITVKVVHIYEDEVEVEKVEQETEYEGELDQLASEEE